MDVFSIVAEDKIKRAYEEGDFEHLPGMGKALPKDELSHVPQELRMAYRLLKNADMMSNEAEIKKELLTIEDLLKHCVDEKERSQYMKKLSQKQIELENIFKKRKLFNQPASAFYKEKVMKKLT